MSQPELLKRVVHALERARIDYMVTGSVASSLQGEPRSTHDIDFVVQIEEKDVPALLAELPRPDFYVDEEAAREAVRTAGMFNAVDTTEGDKVDFWILTNEPFDRSRFSRRIEEEVFGVRIRVSTPEDTIVAKLWWAVLSGGSEKAYTDALRVFEVQAGRLDIPYIREWVQRLGVRHLWERLEAEAEPVP